MNAPEILRLPPHSTEAEQSVLGGLLIGGGAAWDRVADLVTDADFYRDDHRRIFRHIHLLVERGQPADIVTVSTAIEQSNEVDQTGGIAYLADIANGTISAANITGHARIVAEKSRQRHLITVADEIANLAWSAGGMTAQERIDEATGRLLAMAETGAAKDEPREITSILGSVIDAIEARMQRGGEVSGLPTGLTDIDRLLDGLKGGDLIILAGRPSMGKTALALNIGENVAMDGKTVLVFSLEMGDTQLVTRCLSSVGGINGKALASGKMNETDWDRVTVALQKLHQAPLVIDQSSGLSVAQMRARARRQKRKGGLALVIVDYLQLMSGQGNNRNEQLGDITRGLKLMARDLNVPVICLSQLSRKCEERADKRPMLSDLRESGSIEQDADVVAMIYRDEYYDSNSPWKGLAEVLIRKNRMGECGDVKLVFEPEYSRFKDADHGSVMEATRINSEAKPKGRRGGFRDD